MRKKNFIVLFVMFACSANNVFPEDQQEVYRGTPLSCEDKTRKLSREDELDLQDFFGDPEEREDMEMRSRSMDIGPIKMFFMEWGVWAVMRFDDVCASMRSFKKNVRKKIFAFMGWKYGTKKQPR